jgi:hypothetical protein
LLHAQADLGVELAELRVDLRQQRFVVLFAQADDVVEGVEARLPGDEPHTQVLEIEVVAQCRVEVVRRHQLHQVVGLWRLGQLPQANDPVGVLAQLLAHECRQEPALADAVDRGVETLELVGVGLECVPIEQRRAAVHVELAVRERCSKQRLLHGEIGHVARHEDVQGHERALEVAGGHLGPAGAQQRLVRQRPLDPHAIQRLLGALIVLRLEQHRAEHKIRLVANGQAALVVDLDLACVIQLLDRLLGLAVLQQGDAEVVISETLEAVGALQPGQDLDRFAGPVEGQVNVGAQELEVVRDGFRHLAVDALERVQRVLRLILLEVDAREPERRFVAHRVVDIAFEHGADRAACTMVHAVVELEVADVELGRADVVVQRVVLRLVEPVILAEFSVESLQRVEVVALVRVEQGLSEVEVPELVAQRRTRGEYRSQSEPEQPQGRPLHDYQSPISIAGLPDSGPASVTPTSLGSTPLRNAKLPLWL